MNMNKARARKGWKWMFCALAIITMVPAAAFGATIAVTADAPDALNGADGSCALREAIQNINDGADTYADCANTGAAYGTGDTITLPAGTYTNAIASTEELLNANGSLDILADVAITGAGASTTFIDGGAIDGVLHGGAGAAVSLSGVTIRNGSESNTGGGGIYSLGTLTLDSVIVTGNTANNYGGIHCDGGGATITDSTISGNTAGNWGGGVYCSRSPLTIIDSTISGNTASGSSGGGVSISGAGSSLTITGSTISGNSTVGNGGGVDLSLNAGATTITNTTISGNSGDGGGVYLFDADTVLTLVNTTVTDNSGGGILNGDGTVNVTNSIVAGQAAGADCAIEGGGTGSFNSNDYNLDSDNTCGFAQGHDVPGSALANLGALADNGGPTKTQALLSGSAALDAGDCDGGSVAVDQRGVSRPQGSACDIGAYERRQYTLSLSASGSGMITDNGSLSYLSLNCGSTCSGLVRDGDAAMLTLTPASGYSIGSVTGCGGCMTDATTYTTGAFTSDCTVTASFTANPVDGACGTDNNQMLAATPTNLCVAGTPSTVSGTGPWAWTCFGANGGTDASCSANLHTWSVTPSAGANGSISPNTPQTVNHGSTTSFTITSNSGYSIGSVTGCGGSMTDATTYTTGAITSDCTVTASFTANPVDGACGTSNGQTLTSAPTTNFCNTGTPSSISGTGPWTWNCIGANGGADANCSANLQPPPTGDLTGDNIVDMADALKALRIASGIDTATATDLQNGDVAPLVDGAPQPDGVINTGDAVVILRKATGSVTW